MSINKSAIVNILDEQEKSIGTGFFISAKGYIITCFHVLENSDYMKQERVKYSVGEETLVHTAIWIDGSRELDIAILDTQTVAKEYYCLSTLNSEEQKASVSGYPRGVHGLISTRVTIESILNTYTLQLGNANALTNGFSGAPIILNDVAIGMVQSFTKADENGRMLNIAFGIAAKQIIDTYGKYVSTNDLCIGYGDKSGRCKAFPVMGGLCKECFSNRYISDIVTLFEAQNYIVHKHNGFFVAELIYGSTSYFDMIVPIIKFNEDIKPDDLYVIDDYKSRIDKVITQIRIITNANISNECSSFIERNHILVQSKESLLRYIFNLDSYKKDLEKYAYSTQLFNHYIEIYSKYPFSEEQVLGIPSFIDENESLEEKEPESIYIDDDTHENDNREYLKEYVNKFLLSSHNALLLLGEYGSGKSSFCFNYALDLLERYRKNGQPNFFPILIKLRGYNRAVGLNESITNYFVNDLGVANFNIHSLRLLLKSLNVVLVLDGFDEIANKTDYSIKSDVLRDISEFVEDKTKVILTCRPSYFQNAEEYEQLFDDTQIFYEPGDKPPLKFIETTIAELTPFQVQAYICTYEEEIKRRDITFNDIVNAISRTHDLTDLSKRPFLLYMILRTLPELLEEVKDNPETKINAARLYEQYTDTWIKREERRNKTLIKSRDKELFCKELAFELYLSNSLSLSYRQFPNTIKKYFSQSVRVTDIDYFSHDIQNCSFLTSDRTGEFQFIHKSFMEYFVAERVVSKLISCLENEWNIEEIDAVLGKALLSMEICLFVRDIFDLKNIDISVLQLLLLQIKSLNTVCNETVLNLLSILSKALPNIGQTIVECGITDLTNVDFSYSIFSSSRLSFFSFEGCRFYNSSFENLVFYHCDFTNAVFEKATMKNVVFECCVFGNSSWKEASIEKVYFGEEDPYDISDEITDFSKSTWKNVCFDNCRFNDCDLSNNKLINVSIRSSRFRNIDFSGISLLPGTDTGGNRFIHCSNVPLELK